MIRKRLVSAWALLLALALLGAPAVPAAAADSATGTTLRLEESNGTVTVKDSAGKNKTAREGMRLYSGYTVETGARSSAYVSLDETKVVKLDASGKVEIRKTGKKLEVSLSTGQLFFNVTEPLKTDESLNIRTSTMVTGIRGSFGWVTAKAMGLMHGRVTLTCINPETGEIRVTEVISGEQVSYEQNAPPAAGADPDLLEIDFIKMEIAVEDVPAIVAEQVAGDETLQRQLDEDVENIDVRELIESVGSKQEAKASEEAAAEEAVEEALADQTKEIVEDTLSDSGGGSGTEDDNITNADYVFEALGQDAPAEGDGGGGSGGSPPSTPDYVVTADASQLQALINANSKVYYTGSGSVASLNIPAGRTLFVGRSGAASLTVGALSNGGTLTVSEGSAATLGSGTHTSSGSITVNESALFTVASGATLTNTGTIVNSGTFTVAGTGQLTNSGTLTNKGTFNN